MDDHVDDIDMCQPVSFILCTEGKHLSAVSSTLPKS